jgi:hypothetical protein
MNQQQTGDSLIRHAIVFFILAALIFLLRSLWTFPTEHADAVQKYFWSAEIIRTGDWTLLFHNHHTLRWAAMLPQVGLTGLMGTRYEVFYILPLSVFSLYFVLVLYQLRRILNESQLLLLGAILFIEPLSLSTANGFLVPGLGILCSLAGTAMLIRQGRRQYLEVALAAVLFFLAYGAHVTFLSFAAGAFIWLALVQRSHSKAVLFCGTLLLAIVLEMLAFNWLSGWQLQLGRWEALATGPHITRNLTYDPVSFDQFFTRWLDLPFPDLMLCLVFFVAGPWLMWQKKSGRQIPAFISCSYLVGLCFALATSFSVLSIDPLKPVMPLRIRYLTPLLPFASIITVYLWSRISPRVLGKKASRIEGPGALTITVFLLVWPTHALDYYNVRFDAFLWKSHREYTDFSRRFAAGELILKGQKKAVNRMIARFRDPVETLDSQGSISALNPSADALCVDRLKISPLRLNYTNCSMLILR